MLMNTCFPRNLTQPPSQDAHPFVIPGVVCTYDRSGSDLLSNIFGRSGRCDDETRCCSCHYQAQSQAHKYNAKQSPTYTSNLSCGCTYLCHHTLLNAVLGS
jgi:hypothetical protein